jgi:threonine dehydratase
MTDQILVDDISKARETIKPYIVQTPLVPSPNLSHLCDCNLYLKLENLQRCRSFKFRGALNKISQLPPNSTVTCASAGNHSQGTALGATLLGMKSIIYMPATAPAAKVAATRDYGAQVIQVGVGFDEAMTRCKEDLALNPDRTFIPPYDDRDVIAGQGTCGLEILEQLQTVDTVVIPVGGGGLAAGVAIAIKALKPTVRIVCVNGSVRSAFYKKYQTAKGRDIGQLDTTFTGVPLAEGLAVNTPGSITFPIVEKLADEFVVVTEDEIGDAIALLAERMKIVCEGSGAAAFASVLAKKFSYAPDENICCIVSGGNIDLAMLARCIDRALCRWGRRRSMTVSLPLGTAKYISLLKTLNDYSLEVLESDLLPHTQCRPNYVEYRMTVEVSKPEMLEELCGKCLEQGWDVKFLECQ